METTSRAPGLGLEARAETAKPSVLVVGAYDVDARIELMKELKRYFDVSAAGDVSHFRAAFEQAGFRYDAYPLSRRMNPVADVVTIGALVRLFRQRRPDIVHAFATKPCVFARLAARIAGVPVVIGSVPGLGSLYGSDDIRTRLVRGSYEKIQGLASRVSDLTIFQNGDDARQLIEAGVVPVDKALVVPGSGVRADLFDPKKFSRDDRERTRAELGVRPNASLIVMVSRLIRTKGVLEFAGAAEIVRAICPSAHFLLVGPNDDGSMDQLTREELSQVRRVITWAGVRDDMPAVLAASDICVLPSYYREGVPRALIEAASMGLPIVTTDSPGCRDVVVDDFNGLLIPPRNREALAMAIRRLVESPELRRRYGAASRQRAVQRFDLPGIAAQMISIYSDLLARKGLLPASG